MAEDDKRRRFPRTPLSLLVQYRFNSFEDFLAEYSLNISPGGMFIRTDEPHEQGSMVYLQFQLTEGVKLIEGLGRVVHVNPPGHPSPGMGVEFVSLDAESRTLIESIVSERASELED